MRQSMACVVCHAEFRPRHDAQVTCCNRCYMWNQKHPGEPDRPRFCDVCKTSLPPGAHRAAKRCGSRDCQNAAAQMRRHGIRVQRKSKMACKHCGGKVGVHSRGYCSSRCSGRETRFPGSWPYFRDRRCERCDAPVPIEKKREARFCTSQCQNVANAEARRAKGWGARVQPFSRIKVFERDGWTCHICHEPVDRNAQWPQPRSASLDHIIPLAEPGSPGHVFSNAACAHTFCNYSKHDRTRYEDRALYVALDATGKPPLVDALF